MSDTLLFFGTVLILGVSVALPIATYHWGRFEGELIGRNNERQECDCEDNAQDTERALTIDDVQIAEPKPNA